MRRRKITRRRVFTVALLGLAIVFGLLGSAGTLRFFHNSGNIVGPVPSASSTDSGVIDYQHALFVSPVEMQRNKKSKLGSQENPYRTISAAVAAAPPYATIVLRAGEYHDQLLLHNKYLSVVGYPGENIVFDAAERLTAWAYLDGKWAVRWNYNFSHSVTYTEGESNGTEPAWNWLEDDAPYAAWPEQVWTDGTELKQVGRLADVAKGTFYVDESRHLLYIGDDPNGHVVTASTLQQAFQISNQKPPKHRLYLENLTFQNYASSNPQMAAGVFYTDNYDMVNVTVKNSATSAVGVYGNNIHLRGVNIENAGLVGIAGNKTSGVSIENSVIRDFNTQRFSAAPVSGAIKITTSDHLKIKNNTVINTQSNPRGAGIWCDESCSDVLVEGNTIANVRSSGILMEISDRVTITNNLISGIHVDGIRIVDTSNATVRGNNVTAQYRAFSGWQDNRKPGKKFYFAMDNRAGIEPGDAGWSAYLADHMDWKLKNLTVVDNAFTSTGFWTMHPTVSVLADSEQGVSLDGLAALCKFSGNTVHSSGRVAIAISQRGGVEPLKYPADWEFS